MCRFHAKLIYEQPILVGLKYLWRLDDDSYIIRPIRYDVFRLMRDRRIQYGYHKILNERQTCARGLWSAVDAYQRQRAIRFKIDWPRRKIFGNNFELSDIDVWRSPEYRDYIDYIDRTGGIYYYRWGDATIKTAAVMLFVPGNCTHRFRSIGYQHGHGRQ